MPNSKEFEHYISSKSIEDRIKLLGKQIAADYQSKGITRIIAVCVLTGAIPFYADLTRAISNASKDELDIRYDLVRVKSSRGESSSGLIDVVYGPENDPKQEHILIVDDIADTRLTTHKLVNLFTEKDAASVKTAVLLNKESRKLHDATLDYTGFDISYRWVIGYGLDSGGVGRALSYIAARKDT